MDTFINATNLLLQNWEIIGLMLTNVLALFVNPPRKNKLTRSTDNET